MGKSAFGFDALLHKINFRSFLKGNLAAGNENVSPGNENAAP